MSSGQRGGAASSVRPGHVIGGAVRHDGERALPVLDPASGERLGELPVAGEALVAGAVASARAAWEGGWRDLPGGERRDRLARLGLLLRARAAELARLEALDTGLPLAVAREDELPLAASFFLYGAGWADKLPLARAGRPAASLGVVAVLVPCRTPLLRAAARVAPALAAGNTVVLKPSPDASLAAARLGELALEAGLPPGALEVVLGDGETGARLAAHPGVALVSARVSRATADALRHALAGRPTRLLCDAGAHGVHVLFEDAALDQAADGVADAAFHAQAGLGLPGSLLLVQESVLDAVVARLRHRLGRVRVGHPLDADTDVGPLPTARARERHAAWVAAGVAEGATRHEADVPLPERGHFVRPALLVDVVPEQRVVREPLHGPALAVTSFRTPDEALSVLQALPPHAAVAAWTDKGSRLFAFAAAVRAGLVGGNAAWPLDPASAGGGAGLPREGGRQGLLPYLSVPR